MKAKKWIVIADDFTGANDTGARFLKTGHPVKVFVDSRALKTNHHTDEILVLDLESRYDDAETAFKKYVVAGNLVRDMEDCIVYKKIDSTFRGNIGAEIEGLMKSLEAKITFLAAALPEYGRTTIQGKVFVKGIALADTEVANDPRTPVKRSAISEIIKEQCNRQCGHIFIETLNKSPADIEEKVNELLDAGNEIIIFDGETEDHLQQIAFFIQQYKGKTFLVAGSSGLASHIANLQSPKVLSFVFAGSASAQTRLQINHALKHANSSQIKLNVLAILNSEIEVTDIIDAIELVMNQGFESFIFATALNEEDIAIIKGFAERQAIATSVAAAQLVEGFGRIAATLIRHFKPDRVILTGGETAFQTVKSLGAHELSIHKELFTGVVAGKLKELNTTIITKPGSFGSDDLLTKILALPVTEV